MKVQEIKIVFPSPGRDIAGWLLCFLPERYRMDLWKNLNLSKGNTVVLSIVSVAEKLNQDLDLITFWWTILDQAIKMCGVMETEIAAHLIPETELEDMSFMLAEKVAFSLRVVSINTQSAQDLEHSRNNPEAKEG